MPQRESTAVVPVTRAERPRRAVPLAIGGFFLCTGGINLGIVIADTQTYRHFADESYLPFVTRQWAEIVMAHPAVWCSLLGVGEIVLGALLIVGGRAARVGWVGVITFQVLLMLFGFGFWLWSLPALAVLVTAARRDWAVP